MQFSVPGPSLVTAPVRLTTAVSSVSTSLLAVAGTSHMAWMPIPYTKHIFMAASCGDCQTLATDIHVNVGFHFSWVNTKSGIAGSHGKSILAS